MKHQESKTKKSTIHVAYIHKWSANKMLKHKMGYRAGSTIEATDAMA